jgi:hypothetical protein
MELPMKLIGDEILKDQVEKKNPLSEDMLDFTEEFKDYIFDCRDVFSFGIKAENYQFYIELNFGSDQEHFSTECPYDLSQISLITRDNTSANRILEIICWPVFGRSHEKPHAMTAAPIVLWKCTFDFFKVPENHNKLVTMDFP